MIIADENVSQDLINFLVEKNYAVYSIREHHQGVDDRKIIDIIKSKKGILIK